MSAQQEESTDSIVDVSCPNCHKVFWRPNGRQVTFFHWPDFECKSCGWSGEYEWVSPHSSWTAEEHRERLERWKKDGNIVHIPLPPSDQAERHLETDTRLHNRTSDIAQE